MRSHFPGSPGASARTEPGERRGSLHGFRYRRVDTPEGEALLAALLPNPDRLLDGALIYKPGTRTHAGRIVVGGRPYFLKRYNRRGGWYGFRHLFKASRAWKVWAASRRLRQVGFPTPETLLCLEERRLGLLYRSYALTRFVEDSRRLRDVWDVLSVPSRNEMLTLLAQTLARIHGAGCRHGDLKWDNILVVLSSAGFRPWVVDLDGSGCRGLYSPRVAAADLERFLADLRRFDGDPGRLELFRRAWREQLP